MNVFTNFIKKLNKNSKFNFIKWVAVFYIMMLVIYLYVMYADLSTAPEYIYSTF